MTQIHLGRRNREDNVGQGFGENGPDVISLRARAIPGPHDGSLSLAGGKKINKSKKASDVKMNTCTANCWVLRKREEVKLHTLSDLIPIY